EHEGVHRTSARADDVRGGDRLAVSRRRRVHGAEPEAGREIEHRLRHAANPTPRQRPSAIGAIGCVSSNTAASAALTPRAVGAIREARDIRGWRTPMPSTPHAGRWSRRRFIGTAADAAGARPLARAGAAPGGPWAPRPPRHPPQGTLGVGQYRKILR